MKKFFCLSLQRSGTKSFGKFANEYLGLKVCSWKESAKNKLSLLWYQRDIEGIYSFIENSGYEAFEDSPWWHGDLYKFLPYKYPDAKFICLHRPASDWFGSMQRHSSNHPLGNAIRHCEIYQRSYELMKLEDANKDPKEFKKIMTLSSSPLSYLNYHFNYHSEMRAWFKHNNLADRLFMHPLYTLEWENLADFMGKNLIKDLGDQYDGKTHTSNNKNLKKFSNPA